MRRPTERHPPPTWIALPLAVAACQGVDPGNAPPLADAGPDTYGAVGIAVTLDGSGSADPDSASQPLTWRWSLERAPSGSALSGEAPFTPNGSAEAVSTAFVPDAEGLFVVRLRVNDGDQDGLSDFVVVDVNATALLPVAAAGEDLEATEGDRVTLDGSGSLDPLGGELSYGWSLVTVPVLSALGPDDLAGADTAAPELVPDAPGQYLVSLVVTNAVGTSHPDFVAAVVASTNEAPTADIEPVTDLWTCADLALSGASSEDPDGDALTYDWRVMLAPWGSTVGEQPFDDPTGVEAAFFPDVAGEYLVQLVVNDGEADSAPAQSWLDVVPRPHNEAPVAVAGDDKFYDDTVNCTGGLCPDCEDKVVEIDALSAGSYDPDGDPVTWEWRVIQGDATVLDPTSPSTTVTLDNADAREGFDEYYVYKLQIVMTDCLGTQSDTGITNDSVVGFTYQCTGE